MRIPLSPHHPAAGLITVAGLALLLSALPGWLSAQATDPDAVVRGQLGGAIDAHLSTLALYGFSGAVLVTRGDDVILRKGYGWADVERRVPFTTQTGFFIASISKQVIAAAILKLADQGVLSLNDSLGRFFPGAPADKRVITIHQLLTQSSGLPGGLAGDTAGRRYSRAEFLAEVMASRLEFPPGTGFSYSNAGYQLLATLVEEASGRSFGDYLDTHLFGPLGMAESGLYTDSTRWSDDALSHGYNGTLDQGNALLPHWRPYSWTMFGGVVSTMADMSRWERALKDGSLLSGASLERFFTPFREGYAYGWFVGRTSRGTSYAAHDGHIMPEGFNSHYVRYFDEDASVVAFANRGDFSFAEVITGLVARHMFGGTLPLLPSVHPLAHEELRRYVGTYAVDSDASWQVLLEADGLTLEPIGQEAVNQFYGLGAEATAHLATANRNTAVLLDALRSGRISDADSVLPPGEQRERMRRDALRTWQAFGRRWGALRDFSVVHSILRFERVATTMVRLRFERGSTVVYYDWEDGRLAGLTDDGAFVARAKERPMIPGPVALRPQSTTRFTTLDVRELGTHRWLFESDSTGAVVALRLLTGTGGQDAPSAPRTAARTP